MKSGGRALPLFGFLKRYTVPHSTNNRNVKRRKLPTWENFAEMERMEKSVVLQLHGPACQHFHNAVHAIGGLLGRAGAAAVDRAQGVQHAGKVAGAGAIGIVGAGDQVDHLYAGVQAGYQLLGRACG